MPELATAALIRKRAELAGEIEARDTALSQLRADLVHFDAAIRIMSPDTDPEAIRPKKPGRKGCDWFGRGELARMVLDELREAQGAWRMPRSRGPSWSARGCRWAMRRPSNVWRGAGWRIDLLTRKANRSTLGKRN